MTVPRLLFVCTHNAGRSALAAALARAHGGNRVHVESAGTYPDDGPNPVVVASLAELGIDDAAHRPTALTEDRILAADVVIAMKPGLDLPQHLGVRYETWTLPDPAGWDLDSIRPMRDDIDRRVQALLATVGPDQATTERAEPDIEHFSKIEHNIERIAAGERISDRAQVDRDAAQTEAIVRALANTGYNDDPDRATAPDEA